MYRNIKVEAEHNELILENSHGDKVIIPANKRNWVKQKLSEGCHECIDSLVETLPIASQYAQDGSVYPPNKKVKVNENNQIKEYDISSPEYKDLYNSGKLTSYDKNSDTYTAAPLKEVVVTAEAPQWLKDKRKYESQYTKDWYIDNNMPKFSRSMGVSANNMHPNNVKEYDAYINDKVVEDIFKRRPTFDTDYSNDRLKTLQGFSQKELELIKNSSYASKIEPSIWSKFEQGLLSVGNMGSPVQFKNENLTDEEAKKEDNPLNILQPLSIPSKIVQSAYKDNYSFKDALKGKQNNAGIVEDIVTDPLNLVGVGLVGKLSKADKVIDATKILTKRIPKTLQEDVVDLYRIQEKGAKTFSQLAAEGKIPKVFNNEKIIAKKAEEEKYFGQWFTKDKADLDWYARDREFTNPEIIHLKVPKSKLSQYQNYDKTLSRAPEREFVIPHAEQKLYNVDAAKAGSKVLNKTDDVVKAGFPNPLTLLTKPKTLIDNVLGRNQLEKNTSNLYRKIGNKKGLESLIENEGAISPGYDNVWFSKGTPNEDYNGVFAVELSSDKIGIGKNEISKGKGLQTGYKVTNKNNIPLEDLKVYRRRFLSTAYKEIDKTKLANELKTANIQNYIEKLWKYGSQGYLLHEFLAHEFPKDFDKWTPKVEKFYKEKIKPASKSLDEYMWNLITNQNKSEQ